MLINEVEHIVGLSKKSIRYYEENGLLTPKRDQINDYRIYSDEDIRKLKIIKFLRELDVSIRELKLLNNHQMTLQECMNDRIYKITRQEENYRKVKDMCIGISKSGDTFENIDINEYFEGINILNKEGFTMRDLKTSKSKKIIGAVASSLIFSFFFIFILGMIIYFQATETDKMPWLIYFFLILILSLPLIGIVINLIKRIKEINGGEEDEASKY